MNLEKRSKFLRLLHTIFDNRWQRDTKTWVANVPCRHFFLKSQAQAITISRKKENSKIRKSMPNYELKITKVLSALVPATHL